MFCQASLLWNHKCSIHHKWVLESITDMVTLGTDGQFYFPMVTRESMSHDAWCQGWTFKWPANCRGWQRGFLLLWMHIHAKSEGQHCPLRCLLCLLHLLLSQVTALTFQLDWKFKQIGARQPIMIKIYNYKIYSIRIWRKTRIYLYGGKEK